MEHSTIAHAVVIGPVVIGPVIIGSGALTPDQVDTLKKTLDEKTERQKAGLQVFKTTGVPPPPPQQQR